MKKVIIALSLLAFATPAFASTTATPVVVPTAQQIHDAKMVQLQARMARHQARLIKLGVIKSQ